MLRLHARKCQGKCRIPDAILDLMTQKELDGRKNCGEDEKTLENYTTQSTLSNDGKSMSVQKVVNAKGFNAKGAAGASYKTYTNTLIRAGSYKPTADGYMKHFENYWRDKVVGKVKMEKTKQIKREIGEQLYKELYGLKSFISNLTKFMEHLVIAKQIIIVALNRVKSIGTFKQTATGFEVVNPEGYVAIDTDGSAVKLVDRMEFAFNNFTAIKAWDK